MKIYNSFNDLIGRKREGASSLRLDGVRPDFSGICCLNLESPVPQTGEYVKKNYNNLTTKQSAVFNSVGNCSRTVGADCFGANGYYPVSFDNGFAINIYYYDENNDIFDSSYPCALGAKIYSSNNNKGAHFVNMFADYFELYDVPFDIDSKNNVDYVYIDEPMTQSTAKTLATNLDRFFNNKR